MNNFKIRCSAIGQIMTDPKTKKDKEDGVLSQTAKTYLETWYKETMFCRKKEFTNKFLEKGIAVEDEAIELYSFISGNDFLVKNEKEYSNDYCTGTPDVVLPDLVVDVKSSWDLFTFPMFSKDIDNKMYWWQLQGYMWLTDRKYSELAYCLVNTPQDLILKEMNRLKWNSVGVLSEEEDNRLQELLEKNMTFSDIDKRNRVRIFKIQRDEEVLSQIQERVIQCREYISLIHNQLK